MKPWVAGAAPLLGAPSLAPTVTGGGLAGEDGEALVFIMAGLAALAPAGDPGSCLMLYGDPAMREAAVITWPPVLWKADPVLGLLTWLVLV